MTIPILFRKTFFFNLQTLNIKVTYCLSNARPWRATSLLILPRGYRQINVSILFDVFVYVNIFEMLFLDFPAR